MFWLLSLLSSLLLGGSYGVIKPRVFIVNFFQAEAAHWHNIPEFNLLARNISVPGISPLYPDVHCTYDGSICQLITGQAEINSASTMSSLLNSPRFDLTSTYFLLAGIAGISPKHATVGGVTFARYAVQGGTTGPGQYPEWIVGTEVFEVNDALRQVAVNLAKTAKLTDTDACKRLRATYTSPIYAAGAAPPSIVMCDTLTSDTFWTGALLADGFENTTLLLTHQNGVYCSTQQEDNAVLNALLRGALSNLVDFSRIIVMRAGSDFDRPPEGGSAAENLFALNVGFPPALLNLRIAGVKIVQGIVDGWAATFKRGIEPTNDIGDIFGSLGGKRELNLLPDLFGRRVGRG
ncbi:purine nucleoside permease-domain-containing protein [Mycena alexandri]|uniref:Purine nucleoside permease-domain-containing protein n=1 Tax=Mycena alexandri TaxID=1745969 RepID=A0AAD6TDT3_9AGAR|nr:purine nucleoside permease-domain-containing protein [Mycena alexandri]